MHIKQTVSEKLKKRGQPKLIRHMQTSKTGITILIQEKIDFSTKI